MKEAVRAAIAALYVRRTTSLDSYANGTTAPVDLMAGCNATVDGEGNRIFLGDECLMLSDDATSSCPWNNVRQAFVGPGCEYATRLECACLSLADDEDLEEPVAVEMSATYSFPSKVVTLKADQLFSMSFEDLSNIRTLVIVICSIFGCTAFLGLVSDFLAARARKKLLKMAIAGDLAEQAGYRIEPNGAWTWTLDPHKDDGGTKDGKWTWSKPSRDWGDALCKCTGINMKRLRFCVPLVDIIASTKRIVESSRIPTPYHAPSEHGGGTDTSSSDESLVLARRVDAGSSRTPGAVESQRPFDGMDMDTPSELLSLERAIGTSLALAHLHHAGLLSPREFQRLARLASELRWPCLPADMSFAELLSRSCALCSPAGALKLKNKWLVLADAFRLSLLQEPDGRIVACDAVAASLRALQAPEEYSQEANGVQQSVGAEQDAAEAGVPGHQQAQEEGDATSRWEGVRHSLIRRWGRLFGAVHPQLKTTRSLSKSLLRSSSSKKLRELYVEFSKDDLLEDRPKHVSEDVWTTLLVAEWCGGKPAVVLNPHAGLEAEVDTRLLCERYVKRYVKPDDVSIRQLARDTLERWKVDYDELTSEARGCVGEAIKREKEQKREGRGALAKCLCEHRDPRSEGGVLGSAANPQRPVRSVPRNARGS